MDKPITVREKEFKEKLLELVNNSGLPLSLIEYILKDICGAVEQAHKQAEEKEWQEWTESQKTEEAEKAVE